MKNEIKKWLKEQEFLTHINWENSERDDIDKILYELETNEKIDLTYDYIGNQAEIGGYRWIIGARNLDVLLYLTHHLKRMILTS